MSETMSPLAPHVVETLKGVSTGTITTILLKKGMRIANGYGDLKNKTFRVAHMGETQMHHIEELLEAFEAFLAQM